MASPSPDFDSALLSGLSKLMAAQAQESLWLKVVKGKMKSALIAKIAKQCSTDYAVAGRALQGNQTLYKQWGRMAVVRWLGNCRLPACFRSGPPYTVLTMMCGAVRHASPRSAVVVC